MSQDIYLKHKSTPIKLTCCTDFTFSNI